MAELNEVVGTVFCFLYRCMDFMMSVRESMALSMSGDAALRYLTTSVRQPLWMARSVLCDRWLIVC